MGNFAMVTLNCAESNYEPKYHEPMKKQTCMETNNTNKTMTQAEMSNADNVNVNMNVKVTNQNFTTYRCLTIHAWGQRTTRLMTGGWT